MKSVWICATWNELKQSTNGRWLGGILCIAHRISQTMSKIQATNRLWISTVCLLIFEWVAIGHFQFLWVFSATGHWFRYNSFNWSNRALFTTVSVSLWFQFDQNSSGIKANPTCQSWHQIKKGYVYRMKSHIHSAILISLRRIK